MYKVREENTKLITFLKLYLNHFTHFLKNQKTRIIFKISLKDSSYTKENYLFLVLRILSRTKRY